MPKLMRLFVVTILLGAAITGMIMGVRWTGSDLDSGAAIEPERPTVQSEVVQTGAEDKPVKDSANSGQWSIYFGVIALTGLYITGRIIGVRKRNKTRQA